MPPALGVPPVGGCPGPQSVPHPNEDHWDEEGVVEAEGPVARNRGVSLDEAPDHEDGHEVGQDHDGRGGEWSPRTGDPAVDVECWQNAGGT